MKIADNLRLALTVLPGNQPLTLADLDSFWNRNGDVGRLTREQIRRGIRYVPYARKTAKGTYRLKGRRVFP